MRHALLYIKRTLHGTESDIPAVIVGHDQGTVGLQIGVFLITRGISALGNQIVRIGKSFIDSLFVEMKLGQKPFLLIAFFNGQHRSQIFILHADRSGCRFGLFRSIGRHQGDAFAVIVHLIFCQ